MLIKTVLATCLAAAFSLTALPSISHPVWVREAPPEMRVEPTPAARHGYVWAPGYWGWHQQRHHVWHRGTWVRERRGYVYHQPTWVQRDDRWQLHPSRWDRDGDGVPNSRDRYPDNPNRR